MGRADPRRKRRVTRPRLSGPWRRPKPPAAGLGAVLAATVVFSMGFPIVRVIDLPAASIAFWRLLMGATVLGMAVLVTRAPLPTRWWPVAGAGLAFAAHQLIFIQATLLTSIAVVTLLGALQPLLVSVVSRRTVGERVPPVLAAWAVVAVAGVGVVVLTTAGHESRDLVGDLLAALNLVAFTVYFLFAKRARVDGTPTLSFTFSFLTVAFVAIAPFALAAGRLLPPSGTDVAWLAILAMGPGNGHLLVVWAHKRVSAALSSIVLAGIPVLAALWGRIFFDEPFGPAQLVGVALVLVAIEGGRRVERRRPAATGGRLG